MNGMDGEEKVRQNDDLELTYTDSCSVDFTALRYAL